MKLRYYLRGLGVGILVTAVIMTVALSKKQPMTDDEVIQRAKELGMIENTIIKDVATPKEDEEVKEEIKEESQEEIQEEIPEDIQEEVEETPEGTGPEGEAEVEVEAEPEMEAEEVVTVSVISGDSSWSVAKRMEEVGLVDSAKEFDAFLCGNGYDKRISVGTYEISSNATWEDMAKIITKTK